jgi:hypothetical protein
MLTERKSKTICDKLLGCTQADDAEVSVASEDYSHLRFAANTFRYPVRNFRFNQSVLELLAPGNVEMIGASERVSGSETQGRGASLTPAIKVKRFDFTSPSEAV